MSDEEMCSHTMLNFYSTASMNVCKCSQSGSASGHWTCNWSPDVHTGLKYGLPERIGEGGGGCVDRSLPHSVFMDWTKVITSLMYVPKLHRDKVLIQQ